VVERVDAVTSGRTVQFRLHVGGHTLRYDHSRGDFTRRDDLRGGAHAEIADRFTTLLRGRPVRVKHHDGQVLHLELGG
jgi:hypothetical protein